MRNFATLLLLLAFFGACHRAGGKNGKDKEKIKSDPAVRVQTVVSTILPRRVEHVAVLNGRRQSEVYARVAGKISFIGPQEGEAVREGQLLFNVDRSDPGSSFLKTPVVSPFTGWVGRWLMTSVGQQVNAQDSVVVIVDDLKLRATVELPTNDWLRVTAATKSEVIVGKEVRPASVVSIARSADVASGFGTVVAEVDNADHHWKVGMISVVAFELDPKLRTVIPATAVTITDAGPFVYVVKDAVATRKKITFGSVDNDHIEVLSGVSVGEKLITDGVSQVSDQSVVKMID